jgi:hypothetical protein
LLVFSRKPTTSDSQLAFRLFLDFDIDGLTTDLLGRLGGIGRLGFGVNDMNDVNNIINNLVNRDFTFAIQKVDPRSKGNVLVLDEKWYGPHATK